MLRWALVEAIQKNGPGTPAGAVKDAIIARRGKRPAASPGSPPHAAS
jgi:hypothetical protein